MHSQRFPHLRQLRRFVGQTSPILAGQTLLASAFTPQALATFPANLALAGLGLALMGLGGIGGGLLSRGGANIGGPTQTAPQSPGGQNLGLSDFGTISANFNPTFIAYFGNNKIIPDLIKMQKTETQLAGK